MPSRRISYAGSDAAQNTGASFCAAALHQNTRAAGEMGRGRGRPLPSPLRRLPLPHPRVPLSAPVVRPRGGPPAGGRSCSGRSHRAWYGPLVAHCGAKVLAPWRAARPPGLFAVVRGFASVAAALCGLPPRGSRPRSRPPWRAALPPCRWRGPRGVGRSGGGRSAFPARWLLRVGAFLPAPFSCRPPPASAPVFGLQRRVFPFGPCRGVSPRVGGFLRSGGLSGPLRPSLCGKTAQRTMLPLSGCFPCASSSAACAFSLV